MASVSLKTIIEKMKLDNLTPELDIKKIRISQPDINRPALQLAGYFEHFEATRLQVIGHPDGYIGDIRILPVLVDVPRQVLQEDIVLALRGAPCVDEVPRHVHRIRISLIEAKSPVVTEPHEGSCLLVRAMEARPDNLNERLL